MYNVDSIAEEHYGALYDERFENYEEEVNICEGEDCDNKIEEDEHLCNHCKKLIQKYWEDFKSQFNETELDYLIDEIILG